MHKLLDFRHRYFFWIYGVAVLSTIVSILSIIGITVHYYYVWRAGQQADDFVWAIAFLGIVSTILWVFNQGLDAVNTMVQEWRLRMIHQYQLRQERKK